MTAEMEAAPFLDHDQIMMDMVKTICRDLGPNLIYALYESTPSDFPEVDNYSCALGQLDVVGNYLKFTIITAPSDLERSKEVLGDTARGFVVVVCTTCTDDSVKEKVDKIAKMTNLLPICCIRRSDEDWVNVINKKAYKGRSWYAEYDYGMASLLASSCIAALVVTWVNQTPLALPGLAAIYSGLGMRAGHGFSALSAWLFSLPGYDGYIEYAFMLVLLWIPQLVTSIEGKIGTLECESFTMDIFRLFCDELRGEDAHGLIWTRTQGTLTYNVSSQAGFVQNSSVRGPLKVTFDPSPFRLVKAMEVGQSIPPFDIVNPLCNSGLLKGESSKLTEWASSGGSTGAAWIVGAIVISLLLFSLLVACFVYVRLRRMYKCLPSYNVYMQCDGSLSRHYSQNDFPMWRCGDVGVVHLCPYTMVPSTAETKIVHICRKPGVIPRGVQSVRLAGSCQGM